MNDITIVTAFFDIGRGDWTPDKGLPHYLQRTTDTYLNRFSYMAKLENHIIVYTSPDLIDKIKELREDRPTTVYTLDFKNSFNKLRDEVVRVQSSEEYKSKINPKQILNPEYWNADYVVVNALKSSFVTRAIPAIETDLVAWMDFGYCRDESTLNGVTNWQYSFDKEKIHLFNIKEWDPENVILNVIVNNDVHMTGPCIVASKDKWPVLEHLIHHSTNELLKVNLIDDDQTLLLMAYLFSPDSFELHKVSNDDWFIAFKEYNENLS